MAGADPQRTTGRYFRMLVTVVKQKLIAPGGRTIGEFVLVVLGVLVALMVDTWIEQRNDDNLRQEYLVSLTDDLKADQQNLESRISFFTSVYSFGLETLDELQSEEPVNQDTLLAAYYASENWNYAPVINTYEDLQSTGNIRLLGDLDLRLILAAYHTKAGSHAVTLTQKYREIVRGIVPMRIQAAIRKYCPTIDDSGEIPSGFPPCTLPDLKEHEANDVFASLRAYPGIVKTLTYHVSQVDVAIYLYEGQKLSVLDILAQLEHE
jgi:hypothetical protein